MGNTITINGKTYPDGNSVRMIGNNIWIDGVNVTPDAKIITVNIEGNLGELNCDVANTVTITGNVENSVKTVSGDIEIGGFVGGNVQSTSGDIKCNNIGGSVKTTSGDIKYKK